MSKVAYLRTGNQIVRAEVSTSRNRYDIYDVMGAFLAGGLVAVFMMVWLLKG